jgi:hypothetical protein
VVKPLGALPSTTLDEVEAQAVLPLAEPETRAALALVPPAKPRQRPKGAVDPKAVLRIFAHWRERCDHPEARMTPLRANAIRRVLSQGYSEGDVVRAINGAAASDFHQGTNDRGKKYDDITLICRDGSYLEKFWEHAEEAEINGPSVRDTTTNDRVAELRRELAAAQRSGDREGYERSNRELGALLRQRSG